MRLRNVPNAYDKLYESANYVKHPRMYKGRWHEYFKNNNPIHMEIGSGKGRFITVLAGKNPDINYIALEKYPAVLVKLINKIPHEGLGNLAVLSTDAQLLAEIFEKGEVEKFYLNFSDPWPKKRHAKRRLTSPNFLDIYKKVMNKGSVIEFKTDNRGFFDYSVEQFRNSGYALEYITYDLYNSEYLSGNITTEYEEKFHGIGTPINKLSARLEDDTDRKNISDTQPQE